MDIKRNIRLFFVSYGKLLFEILFVIALVIFGLQWLNQKAAEQKQINTQISVENKSNIIEKNNIQDIKQNKENISVFIEYCKNKQIQEAYSMLSDTCKQNKYSSIDLFNKNYVQKYFNIDIEDYEILVRKTEYIVNIKESAISSGKAESIKQLKINIENGILENKIEVYD